MALLVAGSIHPLQLQGQPLRIAGSNLLQSLLGQEYSLDENGRDPTGTVTMRLNGSYTALSDLKLGNADLGIIAIPRSESLPEAPLVVIPLAYQAAAILVHTDNPLAEISLGRLASIFGTRVSGETELWGNLGLTGPWSARSIDAAHLRSGESLAVQIFLGIALPKTRLKSTVRAFPTPETLENFVAQNENAIAISSRAPASSLVRTLSVARSSDQAAYQPTADAAFFDDYAFALPFYIIFDDSKKDALTPVIRRLLSESFAAELGKNSFLPIPERERQRTLIRLGL